MHNIPHHRICIVSCSGAFNRKRAQLLSFWQPACCATRTTIDSHWVPVFQMYTFPSTDVCRHVQVLTW